jgi:hypothetical protein
VVLSVYTHAHSIRHQSLYLVGSVAHKRRRDPRDDQEDEIDDWGRFKGSVSDTMQEIGSWMKVSA